MSTLIDIVIQLLWNQSNGAQARCHTKENQRHWKWGFKNLEQLIIFLKVFYNEL